MGRLIDISFDKIILRLLCWYAFFIPLEQILEVLFNIDTIFKPYRILAILILIVFGIKSWYRWDENKDLKCDFFLYMIFLYGGIITMYSMITTNFHLGYFYNDTFQFGLYLGVFIVLKHSSFSMENVFSVIKSLAYGITANALYILYNFFILNIKVVRSSGFMDNPNYLALSIVVLVLLMITYRASFSGFYKKMLWWIVLMACSYLFIVAGSRSGLLVLLLSGVVVFYFSNFKQKFVIVLFGAIIFFFIGFLKGESAEDIGSLALLNRINKNSKDDPRLPAWRGAVKSAQATHFMGTGIGQFKARFHEFYYQENNDLIRRMLIRGYFLSPHSDYFALLAIYGIIGLLAYLIFLFLTVKNIVIKIYESVEINNKLYYQYSFLAIFVLILFGITAENFISPLFWIVLSTSTKINFS